ncbi:hypothetical protein [Clostridium sp. MD294]
MKTVAETLSKVTNTDLYEIKPKTCIYFCKH